MSLRNDIMIFSVLSDNIRIDLQAPVVCICNTYPNGLVEIQMHFINTFEHNGGDRG